MESNSAGSVVSLPDALAAGGGAYVGDAADVASSSFDGNSVVGFTGHGGAIAMEVPIDGSGPLGDESFIAVRESTLERNVVEADGDDVAAAGGAIYGTGILLEKSLVAWNTVKAWKSSTRPSGGAVALALDGSDSLFDNSTLASNFVVGDRGEGGAIDAGVGTLRIVSSTVAENVAGSGSALHESASASVGVTASSISGPSNLCSGGITIGSHVVATDASCAGASVVADVGLGALSDNGGPTETMEPLPVSPLSDAIPVGDALCAGSDQRGVDRPIGPACDVGAVETTDPMRVIGAWDARLAAGDLDGDEVDDLLAHRPGAPGDGVAWNGDPATFGGFSVQGDYEPLVEDFDGDGVDDVLWYGAGTRADYVWWGDGDRTFTTTATTVNGVYQPFSGDFDGEGATDIIWYAPGGSPDYVWWSDGDRTFSSVATQMNGTYETTTGDYDGDGSDDIVFYGVGTRGDYVWWGAADRGFVSVPRSIGGSYTLVSGDFDGDTLGDLYLHGAGGVADRLHPGESRGSFLVD